MKSIIQFQKAQCKIKRFDKEEIKELLPEILVLKNIDSTIKHNSNRNNVQIKGTFVIKFENCEVEILNQTYINKSIR